MTPETATYVLPPHAAEAIGLFSFPDGADCCDELWFRNDSCVITLYAKCSDTFAFACADVEPIEPSDMPLLRRCLDDLRAVGTGNEYLLAVLFASRKRNRPPMQLVMGELTEGEQALFPRRVLAHAEQKETP